MYPLVATQAESLRGHKSKRMFIVYAFYFLGTKAINASVYPVTIDQ